MKNRIEEIRKARGIRQEEFAKQMGVSRQTISSAAGSPDGGHGNGGIPPPPFR